jgi:hypothetical protein
VTTTPATIAGPSAHEALDVRASAHWALSRPLGEVTREEDAAATWRPSSVASSSIGSPSDRDGTSG